MSSCVTIYRFIYILTKSKKLRIQKSIKEVSGVNELLSFATSLQFDIPKKMMTEFDAFNKEIQKVSELKLKVI